MHRNPIPAKERIRPERNIHEFSRRRRRADDGSLNEQRETSRRLRLHGRNPARILGIISISTIPNATKHGGVTFPFVSFEGVSTVASGVDISVPFGEENRC